MVYTYHIESVLLLYRSDQKPRQPYPKVIPEPSDDPELDFEASVPSPTLHRTLGRDSGWSKEALTWPSKFSVTSPFPGPYLWLAQHPLPLPTKGKHAGAA